MDDTRPDPDQLLARVRAEEERARRGHLKIFFGASAGVGKTYAMLSAARRQRELGIDLLVGVVETHGRKETMAQASGLELLPAREVEHRSATVREFDLDAALARRPGLILMDELAHTNAPGSRHPKRWQDVEELLAAGIDVYTTVNVQHIESLNDVVGGITGVRVWETVPDSVFDRADEVVLVDLPPDELLQRLKDGKVYLPEQAERAIRNFFRKGNLIALRELALRRTADRVDDEMRDYMRESSVDKVWHAREALLATVGAAPGAEKVVRSAARLAGQLNVPWHAIYVETPALQRLPEARRRAILDILKLAESLGAQTATLPAQDAAAEVVTYARTHNITKIIAGAPRRAIGWVRLFGATSFSDRLARMPGDIDIITVAHDDQADARAEFGPAVPAPPREGKRSWRAGALWAAAGTAAATLLATPMQGYFDLANIVMLFLLNVVVIAATLGRTPAVIAAFLNVIAFDFFFVPPRYSFAVSDVQYLFTFAVMLVVGLIIGQLASSLRYQARVAGHREQRSRDLAAMASSLSAAIAEEQVAEIAAAAIERSFRAHATLLLPDANARLHMPSAAATDDIMDSAIAQWVFDRGEAAGIGTSTLPSSGLLYLPLKGQMRTRGVLAIKPSNVRLMMIPEQRRQLETFATLAANALERVHYVTVAREATVKMEGERLRNSLLGALSHDLRTPLTAMAGLTESLSLRPRQMTAEQLATVAAIREQAHRTSNLVTNILDMARLESGEVRLKREWQPVEELVGAAIKARDNVLANHRIVTDLPADLPLIECDALLMERVLVNLLENAAKYTPAYSTITIAARREGDTMRIEVSDDGPGVPAGKEDAIFDKFTRGNSESHIAGIGLGLAICRTIIEAHGGRIVAENRPAPETGARFWFTLPLKEAPGVTPE